MILTSKNNPLIKETASLKEKKGRKETGLFLVEGEKMVRECQRSDFEIERVIFSESYRGELSFAEEKTVRVSDSVFAHLSDEKTPQGVLCRVKIPPRELTRSIGACLILDGVSDPGNVGTIIRTANAAGYHKIYLTDDCADIYSPKCVRASMSGLFFTETHIGSREEILSVLKDTPVVVADMGGENAFCFNPPTPFALVIGNEANGVSDLVRANAEYTVKIPMRSTQESLNAAVSAGILMYLLRRREWRTK